MDNDTKNISETKTPKNRTGLIVGLLIAIFVMLIIIMATVVVPINVNHRYTSSTMALTGDFIKVRINYTVKYAAPIIIPASIKSDAESKIKIYSSMKIRGFIREYDAKLLNINNLPVLQKEFDRDNTLRDIIIEFNIPNVSDKINNIKSIKLNSFILDDKEKGQVKTNQLLSDGQYLLNGLKSIR
jgi:hypothetical protein